jgi:hypothetical protein
VDRDVAARAKSRIARLVESTRTADVVSRAGGFGGLFRVPPGFAKPVMVSSADGVGTKLKVAMLADRHDTVGIDLVNHCVNDILVEGARPLFFLDYIGMGRLEQRIVEELVAGLAPGCRENGCVLLGGETAEMPDFYDPGEYDLAGFIVGMVEEDARPGAHRVAAGDVLIGLAVLGLPHQRLLAAAPSVLRPHGPGREDRTRTAREHCGRAAAAAPQLRAALLPLIGDGSVRRSRTSRAAAYRRTWCACCRTACARASTRASWTVPPEFAAVQRTAASATTRCSSRSTWASAWPGVTTSVQYRRLGDATYQVGTPGPNGFGWNDAAAWNLRLTAGKRVRGVGVSGGLGWDRATGDATVRTPGNGGPGFDSTAELETNRKSLFVGFGWTRLIWTFSAEAGVSWAGTDALEQLAEDPAAARVPFGALSLRLTF